MGFEFRFDAVLSELKARHGILGRVEHTSGGCATLFAGVSRVVDGDTRWTVCAGPGWFHGDRFSDGRGDTDEFVVTYDLAGIDDDAWYESSWWPSDGDDATSIADAMAAVIRTRDRGELLVREARGWLSDGFGDEGTGDGLLSDDDVRRLVGRHYDGGWAQFADDCAPLLSEVAE